MDAHILPLLTTMLRTPTPWLPAFSLSQKSVGVLPFTVFKGSKGNPLANVVCLASRMCRVLVECCEVPSGVTMKAEKGYLDYLSVLSKAVIAEKAAKPPSSVMDEEAKTTGTTTEPRDDELDPRVTFFR